VRNTLLPLVLAFVAGCATTPAASPRPATTATAGGAPPAVAVVAHRGESADAPENTLAAFRLAWERNVSAIELDVHLTRDGRAVVSHDADTKRTTGVEKVIVESTLAELRALDAGRWKGERWAGERLPTLEDALATIPAGGRCFVEIKVGPEAVPAVRTAIRESGRKPGQFVIISFNLETVAEAKRQLPEIEAYYLASFRQDERTGAWTPSIDELIARARAARLDGLNLAFRGPVDSAAVRRIKAAGLGIYVWTVDDADVARRMAAAGVDGITTNRAAWLRAELGRR
jgi:glycerophosphoryl diester phosphodiesterase